MSSLDILIEKPPGVGDDVEHPKPLWSPVAKPIYVTGPNNLQTAVELKTGAKIEFEVLKK